MITLVRASLLVIAFWVGSGGTLAQESKPTREGREAYFLGFSGYSVPLEPRAPVSKAEAEKQTTYFRGKYDADDRLIEFEKRMDGQVEFRQEYFYYPNGVVREAHVSGPDGRVDVHKFDESGNRLDTR